MTPLLTVRDVALYLTMTEAFVYEHARELGAIRLGSGPRARLRFRLEDVERYLASCSAGRESSSPEPAPAAVPRRRRRRALGTKS